MNSAKLNLGDIMKNHKTIRTLSLIALLIIFFPALAVTNPQLAPLAEESLAEKSLMDETSLRETSIIKVMDSHGDFLEALEGIDYDLQASNTDIQTRGLFHNGISYILVSNTNDAPKTVVVNPQINDWNMQTVQVKYGNIEVEKVWNYLQIRVPAFRSGLIIVHPSELEEKSSAGYNYHVETFASEEKPSTVYNCPGERCSSLWKTSIIRVDDYGQLTVDGLSGVDYDLQSSNMDVLTRGLFYNGIAYILVANPDDMPKEVIVNPQISNWYIQNVQVRYGTLMVSKLGNQLHITVPGCQSALICITPQKKRYSFEAGPKPAYSSSAGPKPAYSSSSFRAGPKPNYSFQAGPRPRYSFRIGY